MQATAFRLPVTIRLPVAVATMIFIAAVASTQTAIVLMTRQVDRQAEMLGQVYLDGLSAALLPHVAAGDLDGVRAAMRQSLDFYQGLADRRLAFIDRGRGVTVEVTREGVTAETPIPANVSETAIGFLNSGEGDVWVWRELDDGRIQHGIVAANLDVSTFQEERGKLRWGLLLLDLVFSGICAVIGFFMVRHIQKPVTVVAHRLYQAAFGLFRPMEPSEMPKGDWQAERMFHAFNAMTHATREREELLSHLAARQREADLGRLTATIAHEVRNPLGGMRTAISTLKRFGHRPEVRGEVAEFLERGVVALEGVVSATLESYRARPEWRRLSRRDFEDLHLLVEADGRSRNVSIALDLDMPDSVAVAALEVRQILLNLLLNAIRASSAGDTVWLKARLSGGELQVTVKDEGGGLDPQLALALESGRPAEPTAGLGVAVVIRLVERLRGRVSVEALPGRGTTIALFFPLQDEENAA